MTKFLFESDFTEDPQLPSPAQLKYRILIKNKKLREPDNPLALKKVSSLDALIKEDYFLSISLTSCFFDETSCNLREGALWR